MKTTIITKKTLEGLEYLQDPVIQNTINETFDACVRYSLAYAQYSPGSTKKEYIETVGNLMDLKYFINLLMDNQYENKG